MMRNIFLIFSFVAIVSCKSKSNIDPDTLPKDIALRPANEEPIELERKNMENLRKEIDSIIGKETCTDASQWRISPIGVKSCGGPAGFIAYPIKYESDLLTKIRTYTEQSAAFNKKYKILSDCAVVPAPTGITCSNGKAVLNNFRIKKAAN